MRALVLDDARAARRFLGNMLTEFGWEFLEGADGHEGLDCLNTHGRLDIAFVDLNMPGMDGLGFIREVRKRPELNAMPLIVVSTESEADRIAECLQSGANEYVMKPYTREVILEKLTIVGATE